MTAVNVILQKLRDLESSDQEMLGEVHGAEPHEYQMLPSVPQSEIESWEQVHGVVLPTQSRDFLLSVGNGPCGPGFGLMPFPPINPNAGLDCRIDGPVNSDESDPLNRYDEIVQDQRGFIQLADYGCAMYAILVLNGRFGGEVWFDGAGTGDISPFPLSLHALSRDGTANTRVGFSDWYADWLDCAINGRAIP